VILFFLLQSESERATFTETNMKYKRLGKTDVKVPEIGLGTWQYRGGIEPLKVGISLGANLIDTAEMYSTEGIVGKAIEGIREDVFVATKVSPQHFHYDDVIKAADASLRRLNIKTIDLYQLHWPNPRIPIRETMKAMEELVKQGKIKYIGVSNFSVEQMKEASDSLSSSEIVSNQVEYSLVNREIERDILPYCESNGITVIAYTPLARGRIAEGGARKILDGIATKYKKTRAQVALNWLISKNQNVIAIPKADRVEHVKENCGASGWTLSEEDIQAISEET
jgi:diketogulonate reductase-like aldo/keto reductase